MVAGPAVVVEKARIWRTRSSSSLLQTLSSVCNSAQAQSHRISFSIPLSSPIQPRSTGLKDVWRHGQQQPSATDHQGAALSRDLIAFLFLATSNFTTSEFLSLFFFFFRLKDPMAGTRVASTVVSCLRFVRGRICALFYFFHLQISARN